MNPLDQLKAPSTVVADSGSCRRFARLAPRQRRLDPAAAARAPLQGVCFDEPTFRGARNDDAMGTETLADGIRGFAADAANLDKMIGELR